MSCPLRIEYPGTWYHVMNRGRRSESVFLSRRDYEIFFKLLQEASTLWIVHVAVYLSRRLRNDTLDQLCKDFFLNSHSSASSILRKTKQRIGEDSGFKRKVAEIEGECLKSQVQI